MQKSFIPSLLALCLVAYFIAHVTDELSDKVTVYVRVCIDQKTNVRDCEPPRRFSTERRFRVDYAKQTVIQNTPDIARALNHCTVFDRENWRCGGNAFTKSNDDGSAGGEGEVIMSSGQYDTLPEDPFNPSHEMQISFVQYWLDQMDDAFSH